MLLVDNVRAGYGAEEVLKGISFQADTGEVHGILGVNGSGKTTLFRVLNGWLPKTDGTISFGKVSLSPSQIGFLETDPYFYPYMKGSEYIALMQRHGRDFDVAGWNAIFDLPLDRLADEYSTGMKKKLALLGLLAQDRPFFILDEPLSGVDIESNIKIQEIIIRLKNQDKVVMLSSHMIEALVQVCDKISLLSEGRIKKTYVKSEFAQLSDLVTDEIKSTLDGQLDQLLN